MPIIPSIPANLQNGTVADATQVMANFNQILTDINNSAAPLVDAALTTPMITGGTISGAAIDNSPIGAVTPAAGSFTAVVATGDVTSATNISAVGNVNAAGNIEQAGAILVPPGIVSAYAGTTAPTGYLLCDGSAVSRTTYAALFAVAGIAFGSGDGTTTFNVPDTRGYFLRGWASGGTIDPARVLGTTQTDALKTHNHAATVSDPKHSHSTAGGGNFLTDNSSGTLATSGGQSYATSSATTLVATGVTVAIGNSSPASTETRPVNLAINYIIKI